MVRLMTGVRVGVVTLLAVVLLNTIGVFSLGDVSAAGEAGISKVPSLFKDKGGKDGGATAAAMATPGTAMAVATGT